MMLARFGLICLLGACSPGTPQAGNADVSRFYETTAPPTTRSSAPPLARFMTSATLGIQPKSVAPNINGSFDFEVVGDADGKGCFDDKAPQHSLGNIPLVNEDPATPPLVRMAVGAAIFDALSRIKEADTIFVVWTKFDQVSDEKACAEVHGKGIRLYKTGAPRKD